MRIKNTILAIFVLCVFSISVYADSAKDAQIHTMLVEIDKATENKDGDTIARYLDDNIHITLKVTVGSDQQDFQFNKESFLKELEDGWAVTEEYAYAREEITIEYIGDGNKAVVTSSIYELSILEERPMAALSHEKALVEFRPAGPIIINLSADTNVRM